jgi:hypothetical protein
MAAFWSSIEAFLTSSSSTATATATVEGTAEGAGAGEGDDSFAQLWGKTWPADSDAGEPVFDLFTHMDDALKAEDILQQDIFA